MIILSYKSPFKKIAIAVLLLAFASWSHDGLVICYGADGHVEIERPSNKECCKKPDTNAPVAFSELSELGHCIDVPIRAVQYIGSTSHPASLYNYSIPLGLASMPTLAMGQPCTARFKHTASPPHIPLLAALKTVVLLI